MNRTDILVGAVAFAVALMIALAVAAWSLLLAPPAKPRPELAEPTTEAQRRPGGLPIASARVTFDGDRRNVTVVGSGGTPDPPPQPQGGTGERPQDALDDAGLVERLGDVVDAGLVEPLEEVVGVDLVNTEVVDVELVDQATQPVTEGGDFVHDALEPVADLLPVD